MSIQRHGLIFDNQHEADVYFGNQKADQDFARLVRIQSLRNARAVLCTLSGMDQAIERIGIELKALGE